VVEELGIALELLVGCTIVASEHADVLSRNCLYLNCGI